MTTRSTNADAAKLLATTRRFALRNRLQQVGPRCMAILVVIACAVIVALVCLASACATSISDALTLALRFPIVVTVIVGWMAMTITARQRRQSRRDAERSWLAALPLADRAFERAARRHVATVLTAALLFLLALLLAFGWMLELSSRSVLGLSLLLILGEIFGAVVGWTLSRNDPRPSRIRLPSIVIGTTTQRFPLGRWPLRHSRAHADLALHARAIGLLLLSLPIGIPPLAVIAVIVFGLAALTIWDVLRALVTTTRFAGAWLRSLPLPARRATLALGGRSILVIIVATAIILIASALPMGMTIANVGTMIVATGVVVVGGFLSVAMLQRPFGARR